LPRQGSSCQNRRKAGGNGKGLGEYGGGEAVLKKTTLSLALVFACTAAWPALAENFLVYVGSYTDAPSTSKGIYAARFDSNDASLTPLGLEAETVNPAYLTGSKDGRFLYAVNWQTPRLKDHLLDTVTAYRIDQKSGKLTLLNVVTADGALPNEALVDPSGRVLIAANYGSGVRDGHNAGISAMKILPDGKLADPFYVDIHPNEPIASPPAGRAGGRGDPLANFGAHTHGIAFSKDDKYVFIADLGLDRLYTYRFDAAKPSLQLSSFIKIEPNAGPRRLTVSPDGRFLYCNNQDNAKVGVYKIGRDGALTQIQEQSTLAPGVNGRGGTAEIAMDPGGNHLYVSNRGDSTIAVYGVNKTNGLLTPLEWIPAQGKSPRNMTRDPTGKYLFVANQMSDDMAVFKIDPANGHLDFTGAKMSVSQAAGMFIAKAK
jgi:6-phosphogluconolactonase